MTQSEKSKLTIGLWPWVICGLGAIYYCYEYFLRISPSVMTPELMRAYDLNGAQVGNLSAFYYHAYTPMQIFVGLLMDRYGPRRLLTLACLLSAVGIYLFTSGGSLWVAQTGRFLVGFGAAFAFVGALKLATVWLPPNRFALISGIITTLGMIGAMAGDILLREMVDAIGWQMTNYIAGGAGIALALGLWVIVRDANPHPYLAHVHHIDTKSLFQELGKVLVNPQIWLAGCVGFLLYLSLSAFGELWGIPYLEQAQGLTKSQAAFANSMVFLGWAIGAPFWGWFSDYIARRCLTLLLSTIMALICVVVLLYAPHLSLTATYFLLLGFGIFTSVEILVFALCREVSSAKVSATAIALTNMIIMIGGNIFQPVMGRILDMNWSGTMIEGARIYSSEAYSLAMSILPIGLALAMVLTLFIKETEGRVKIED